MVLETKSSVSADAWAGGWWRFPFLFSLLLLVISLWMRLKLSESPVFRAMREAGEEAETASLIRFGLKELAR